MLHFEKCGQMLTLFASPGCATALRKRAQNSICGLGCDSQDRGRWQWSPYDGGANAAWTWSLAMQQRAWPEAAVFGSNRIKAM